MKGVAETIAIPLLGALFVVLKLAHVIGWSWWWVTVPFWGYFALAFVVFVIGFPLYSRRQQRNVCAGGGSGLEPKEPV